MLCLWVSYKKKYEKNIFCCILKINEESSRIRSWIRFRIRTKMSQIPNTAKEFQILHSIVLIALLESKTGIST